MANLSEQMDAVINPSENYATGFLTGQRAGDFQAKDGTVNRGVWVGNAKPTVFNLINPKNAYSPDKISVPTSQYLPLSTFQQQSFVVPNYGIVFDAPRCLTFFGDEQFTVIVSSYTQWGQKQSETVVAELVDESYFANTLRGVKVLTAAFIQTSVSNNIGFTANDTFEMPYTDNGVGTTLIQVLLANQPVMVVPPESSPPYAGTWNFAYFTATTNPDGRVRPLIGFNGGDTGVIYPDNSILTVLQTVDNAGFTFDNNFLDLENPYPNNIDKVIGVAPNSTNFVGWQG